MSDRAINQSPDAVRRLSAQNVKQVIASITWLSPEDRACLSRLMAEMLPRWDAALHSERLLKFAKGDIAAGDVRAAGVIVLSNMLAALAKNTTAHRTGEDSAARETAVFQSVRHLHRLILENLLPEPDCKQNVEDTDDAKLAVDFNHAIYARFGEEVDATVIAIAATTIFRTYVAALPTEARAEMVDRFVKILNHIRNEP